MTVELLQTLSIVSYIIAGAFLLVGITLFFWFDVPKLYGDISGRTARKAIENIRLQNEADGNKANKPSVVNAERGKLTEKITMSGRLETQNTVSHISVGTEKFSTSMLAPQTNETTYLNEGVGETSLLVETSTDIGQTTYLGLNEDFVTDTAVSDFAVGVEMYFTGADEIIE